MKNYSKPELSVHSIQADAFCLGEEDVLVISNTENGGLDGGELEL